MAGSSSFFDKSPVTLSSAFRLPPCSLFINVRACFVPFCLLGILCPYPCYEIRACRVEAWALCPCKRRLWSLPLSRPLYVHGRFCDKIQLSENRCAKPALAHGGNFIREYVWPPGGRGPLQSAAVSGGRGCVIREWRLRRMATSPAAPLNERRGKAPPPASQK